MGAVYKVNPSEEPDTFKYMRRPDLYQFADLHKIDYPKDAPAEIMKVLLRASGVAAPTWEDFNVASDPSTGQVKSIHYKRLHGARAPRSRHADADEAATSAQLAKRRQELEAMNPRKLKQLVRDQFGEKILNSEPTREDIIAMFVGEDPAELALPAEAAPVKAQSESPPGAAPEVIPAFIVDSMSPPMLVKACKQYGLEASMKEGKQALVEKLRAHGHAA